MHAKYVKNRSIGYLRHPSPTASALQLLRPKLFKQADQNYEAQGGIEYDKTTHVTFFHRTNHQSGFGIQFSGASHKPTQRSLDEI
jgi:hypothetical protein